MKDFQRNNLLFSLCGLNCGLCPMKLGGSCPGCGGGEGNQSCKIARCSLRHNGVEYCFQCPEYPCEKYQNAEEFDSFITHQNQLKDITRAQFIGIETYNKEQIRKISILNTLLAFYNDGRRKTFYSVAINLLPLEDIEDVMGHIEKDDSFGSLTQKEQAEQLVSLFENCAKQNNIVIKLRKKPN